MSDKKSMQLSFANGTLFMMQWPDSISTEDLELIEQVITLQLRSVRRTIERRKSDENQLALSLPAAEAGQTSDAAPPLSSELQGGS